MSSLFRQLQEGAGSSYSGVSLPVAYSNHGRYNKDWLHGVRLVCTVTP